MKKILAYSLLGVLFCSAFSGMAFADWGNPNFHRNYAPPPRFEQNHGFFNGGLFGGNDYYRHERYDRWHRDHRHFW